MNKPVKYI